MVATQNVTLLSTPHRDVDLNVVGATVHGGRCDGSTVGHTDPARVAVIGS
jgi:hypothetical protein